MYEIIDFHSHIYPDKIAQKATEGVSKFYCIKMAKPIGSVDVLLDSGNNAGIGKFVVHSVATTARQVQSINNFIIDQCNKHSDRFLGFMAMHPDLDKPLDEVDRAVKLGLKGIKIHPDVQTFNLDDERMFPIYDYIQGKIPVLIHCGDYRYDYSHPRRLAKILKLFPKLTVIGAHFGGWSLYDLAMEFLLNENCFIDTSSSFTYLGKVRSREIIKSYGFDRVVFGVDFPMWDHKSELDFFLSLGFSEEQNKKILHDNAAALLNL
ncbi:MAG: amidohydrolase family protein [Clostridia bacterium]|nr:amidohydrolase family protein [Clostridia bacterium]